MIHLLDLLIYAALLALGAALMHIVHGAQEKAVRAEHARTEHWRRAYEDLRYDTKPFDAPAPAPAPLQLTEQDAWTMRQNGQVKASRRA